jgi:hypothetical protein
VDGAAGADDDEDDTGGHFAQAGIALAGGAAFVPVVGNYVRDIMMPLLVIGDFFEDVYVAMQRDDTGFSETAWHLLTRDRVIGMISAVFQLLTRVMLKPPGAGILEVINKCFEHLMGDRTGSAARFFAHNPGVDEMLDKFKHYLGGNAAPAAMNVNAGFAGVPQIAANAWEWLVQSGASAVGSEMAARRGTRVHFLGPVAGAAASAGGGFVLSPDLRQLANNLEAVLRDDRSNGISYENIKWFNTLAVATTVMAWCTTQIRRRYWPPKKLASKKLISKQIKAIQKTIQTDTAKPHSNPQEEEEFVQNQDYQNTRLQIEDFLGRLYEEVRAVNNDTARKREVLRAIRDDVDKIEEELLDALSRYSAAMNGTELAVANEIDNNIRARRGGGDGGLGLGPLNAMGAGLGLGGAQAAPADRSGSIVEQVFAAHAMRRALERAQ